MALTVTAIIVTRDRPDWLKRLLESLLVASGRSSEVALKTIVGLNGPDPASERVLGDFQQSHDQHTLVVTREQEPLTPAAARNRLISTAQGDWLLFIDDDAYVEPDYFERFLEALREFPEAAVVGGPNLTPPGSTPFQRATGLALSSRFATYLTVTRYRKEARIRPCGENQLILCNLFARRDSLPEAPFPENFFCGEENWLLGTLVGQGHLLIHSPELFVWHERRRTFRELLHQVYSYGRGRGLNLRARPEAVKLVHVLPSICILFTLLSISLSVITGSPPALWTLLFLIYSGLCLGVSARIALFSEEKPPLPESALVLGLFPAIHFAYGLGVITGWAGMNR